MLHALTFSDTWPVKESVGMTLCPVKQELVRDIQVRMREHDPAQGFWTVNPDAPVTVWTDASSIAYGVVLEAEGRVIEDGSWLRPTDDSTHINRCELDAAIKGVNLALKWGKKEIKIKTDSVTACRWLKSVVEQTQNVRTRALA